MPKKTFYKPPEDIVKEWPEIFSEVYMEKMPIQYLHGVEIEFDDGRVWEIDIEEQIPYSSEEEVIEKILMALEEMSDEVKTINFTVDVHKLKDDIINSTKNILGEE